MERTTPPPWTLQVETEEVLLCSLALCYWSGVYCVAVHLVGVKCSHKLLPGLQKKVCVFHMYHLRVTFWW